MHDGSIVHQESTRLGQVATRARKVLYSIPTTSEEDDLAGVSTLMKALPDKSVLKTNRKARSAKRGRRAKPVNARAKK